MVAFDKFLQGTRTDSKRQGQTALLHLTMILDVGSKQAHDSHLASAS